MRHPAEFFTVMSPVIPSAGPRDLHESHLSHGRASAPSPTEQWSNVIPPIALYSAWCSSSGTFCPPHRTVFAVATCDQLQLENRTGKLSAALSSNSSPGCTVSFTDTSEKLNEPRDSLRPAEMKTP